ncbi:MAG: T9SS type A sorting domain-containing protein [Bacteroidota bacterium]
MNKYFTDIFCLLILFVLLPSFGFSQDPLNRSVQVSMEISENPLQFDFSWDWDWWGGGYTIYRKSPEDSTWGTPIGDLPFGSTDFTDENVQAGVPYEYAFYKKEFEKVIKTIDVPVNETLVLTFENIYGDGLCCNFGFGWYEAELCGQVVAGGSQFGFLQSDTFTVCDNGNPTETLTLTIRPDMQVNNSWWNLTDLNGNNLANSGYPSTWLDDRPIYGYILAGKELTATENRGSILLLVDDVYTSPLETEIAQLEQDLIGDGWKVVKDEVNRNDAVQDVKALITSAYDEHEDLEMVYLLGHVPVPYSGNIFPDGHIENHWGAWAAEVYYGDLDGEFTDTLVDNVSAQLTINHNVPGDGKFDQSAIPSEVELIIGRVDLYDMPAFGLDDVELTRRYLQKAHLFKTGQRDVKRRALVDDNLNVVLASPAASGWRNFAPMFTADSVQKIDYFSSMRTDSYLWSYGCGGGTHQSADGIGSTTDFANDTLQNIFTMLLGSQFGDWDNTNNFLRAPLASPSWTLTNCWAGNPPYTFHKMAMGEPIGYGLLATQNATEDDYYPGPALVHTSLMGDPTLRLHPVKMPADLVLYTTDNKVELNWQAPENEEVVGFYIYRKDSISNEFIRLHEEPVTDTFYTDQIPPDGFHTYMVRTLKLEQSGSGTYFNLSLGITDSISFRFVSSVNENELNNLVTVFPNPTSGEVFIDYPVEWGKVEVELVDVEGKVVLKRELDTKGMVSFERNYAGIYFLKIKNEQGVIFERKLILN